MAPEQVEGKEVDARGDIFAFGAVLHEMTTGKRPFEGSTPASVIGAILKDEPPPVSRLQPLAPLPWITRSEPVWPKIRTSAGRVRVISSGS